MSDMNEPTLQTPTAAIALPPLKMILVHGLDSPPSAQASRPKRIHSQAVKKLIAHLEEKQPPAADEEQI